MNLDGLNKEQRLAAETLEGPVLILAGAGSGKTRALTYRVANLIDHGVAPWHILAITFTNKAAKEMKERVSALTGEKGEEVWVSTFHSMCARILRRDIDKLGYTRSFTIYDEDDQSAVLKEQLKHFNIDDKMLSVRELKGKISDAKNKLLSPDEWFRRSEKDFSAASRSTIFTMATKSGSRPPTRWTSTICWCAHWNCSPIILPCWKAIGSAFSTSMWTSIRIPTSPSTRW